MTRVGKVSADSRLRSALRRLGWSLAILLALFLLVAERVKDDDLAKTSFYTDSVVALTEALAATKPGDVGELMAGSAGVEIAPPVEWQVPMAGNRQLRFTRAAGKHPESVWARALALEQAAARLILISADIMVIHRELATAVLDRIGQEVDLERHQLMLVAAHTHSGPGGYWEGFLPELSVGPYQERIEEFLVERLAAAGVAAWKARQPVSAASGQIAVELPIQNRAIEGGPENAALSVLRLTAAGDGSIIDLVNYSAHPTNLLKGNDLLTGDYPALIAKMALDADRGHSLVFTPGTIGDMKPWFHHVKNRRLMATSVAEILYSEGLLGLETTTIEAPVLESFEFEVRLPPLQPRILRADWLGSWSARRWLVGSLFPESFDRAVVQVVRLGRFVLIGAPSDLGSALAAPLYERARKQGLELMFASMAEEWIGYVLSRETYDRLDYKETSQFHGPLSGPLFGDIYGRLIDALAERARADAVVAMSADA